MRRGPEACRKRPDDVDLIGLQAACLMTGAAFDGRPHLLERNGHGRLFLVQMSAACTLLVRGPWESAAVVCQYIGALVWHADCSTIAYGGDYEAAGQRTNFPRYRGVDRL